MIIFLLHQSYFFCFSNDFNFSVCDLFSSQTRLNFFKIFYYRSNFRGFWDHCLCNNFFFRRFWQGHQFEILSNNFFTSQNLNFFCDWINSCNLFEDLLSLSINIFIRISVILKFLYFLNFNLSFFNVTVIANISFNNFKGRLFLNFYCIDTLFHIASNFFYICSFFHPSEIRVFFIGDNNLEKERFLFAKVNKFKFHSVLWWKKRNSL